MKRILYLVLLTSMMLIGLASATWASDSAPAGMQMLCPTTCCPCEAAPCLEPCRMFVPSCTANPTC